MTSRVGLLALWAVVGCGDPGFRAGSTESAGGAASGGEAAIVAPAAGGAVAGAGGELGAGGSTRAPDDAGSGGAIGAGGAVADAGSGGSGEMTTGGSSGAASGGSGTGGAPLEPCRETWSHCGNDGTCAPPTIANGCGSPTCQACALHRPEHGIRYCSADFACAVRCAAPYEDDGKGGCKLHSCDPTFPGSMVKVWCGLECTLNSFPSPCCTADGLLVDATDPRCVPVPPT